MCRGPGRVMRQLLMLVESGEGPWTLKELCREVYHCPAPTDWQKREVRRALASVPLPPGWSVGPTLPDSRWRLFNESRCARWP
jgi:hypothetical protein